MNIIRSDSTVRAVQGFPHSSPPHQPVQHSGLEYVSATRYRLQVQADRQQQSRLSALSVRLSRGAGGFRVTGKENITGSGSTESTPLNVHDDSSA